MLLACIQFPAIAPFRPRHADASPIYLQWAATLTPGLRSGLYQHHLSGEMAVCGACTPTSIDLPAQHLATQQQCGGPVSAPARWVAAPIPGASSHEAQLNAMCRENRCDRPRWGWVRPDITYREGDDPTPRRPPTATVARCTKRSDAR